MADIKNDKIIVNATPATTWNWLKLNSDSFSYDKEYKKQELKFEAIPQGFSISDKASSLSSLPEFKSSVFNALPKKEIDRRKRDGSYLDDQEFEKSRKENQISNKNHPLIKLIDKTVPEPQYIKVSGSPKEALLLHLDEEKNCSNTIAKHIIQTENGSDSTIVILYSSDSSNQEKCQLVQSQILLGENSHLTLIKVQLLGKKTLQLDDTSFICGENSKVDFVQIELGGNHVDSGIYADLLGNRSDIKTHVTYLFKEDQYLDMNHWVVQHGKRTKCDMYVDGTLKDQASKIYRGTIDLQKGCSGSTGNEMENTLTLSPKVVNKSMPNILCLEDDIAAEHGATIGKLSKEVLFYMESRGIDEETAQKIIARAKIQRAADFIPSENIREVISNYLESQGL
ncbi:MAG: SufD family Fe-S cluster assembly protein [Treponema sp.]|nr:SufD family Fe-S cluster assembly protein [Treponema sp.]